MEVVFDTNGNAKQKLAAQYWCDNESVEVLYGGAKYGGKSYLGCNLIFGDAMIYPETHYFIARESLTDLRKYTIPSVHEVFQSWGLNIHEYAKYNGQDNYFLLSNGSKVYFLECRHLPRDPDFHRFGSIQMTRGWCEEIGQIHPSAISNLLLTVGRWKNREYGLKKKLLLTCNPHKGYGYKYFYKPSRDGTLIPSRKFIVALPQDNKAGDPEYIESLKNNVNKNEVERLYFGNWEYDDDPNVLMNYDHLLDMFTNTVDEDDKFYLVADIARLGSDRTVLSIWKGLKLFKLVIKEKQRLDITKDQIKDLAREYCIPYSHIVVDEDGVGGGVVDYLSGIKGFVNNSSPLSGNYANLKTQCTFKLAEYVDLHKIEVRIDDSTVKDLIVEELEQLKSRDIDKDNKIKMVKKEDMKTVLGRSPDLADIFIMRMYFEIADAGYDHSDFRQPQHIPTTSIGI